MSKEILAVFAGLSLISAPVIASEWLPGYKPLEDDIHIPQLFIKEEAEEAVEDLIVETPTSPAEEDVEVLSVLT